MYKLCLLLAACLPTFLAAQKAKLVLPNLSDSSTWTTQVPQLALAAVPHFKSADSIELFDNRFRLHLAANQFPEAITALQQLRHQYAELEGVSQDYVGIQFEIYARLRSLRHLTENNRNELFDSVFTAVYGKISEQDKPRAEGYFGQKASTAQATLSRLIQQATKKSTDSIDLKDALPILRAYASWQTLAYVGKNGQANIKSYEIKHFEGVDSVLVKTKSGGELAVFIYRKKVWMNEKRPAILVLNIYANSANNDKSWAKEIANKGYVGVIANVRGKRNSSNAIQPFEWESQDGYDLIDWITKQPWSDGRVGMYGGSYLGFAQWATAKKLHSALKTIVPQVAVGAGIDFPMYNGVFYGYSLMWARYVTSNKHTNQREFADTSFWNKLALRWYSEGLRFRDFDSLFGERNAVWQNWLNHPTHDSYWQKTIPVGPDFKRINIPVLSITGYFDDDQHGAMHYLREHYKQLPQANHYLLIGPYDHPGAQGNPAKKLRGYTIDSVAQLNIDDLVFEWFDHVFYQKPKPSVLRQKINYQVAGTNKWAHAPSWDAFQPKPTPYYWGKKDSLNRYQLSRTSTSKKSYLTLEANFRDRSHVMEFDPLEKTDNTKLDTYNSLVFEYTPTPGQSIFNGYWDGQIDISINKKDVDLIFMLYEQRKDGTYFPLSSHLIRASQVNDPSKRVLLELGRITRIPLRFPSLFVKKLEPGSKLVLTAGVNQNPWNQVNYGTGKDVSNESISDATEPLQMRWYNSSFFRFPLK